MQKVDSLEDIRCVASALSITDWAIVTIAGAPAVARAAPTSEGFRVQVFPVAEHAVIVNHCDRMKWSVAEQTWQAEVIRGPLDSAGASDAVDSVEPILVFPPGADQERLDALGLAQVVPPIVLALG